MTMLEFLINKVTNSQKIFECSGNPDQLLKSVTNRFSKLLRFLPFETRMYLTALELKGPQDKRPLLGKTW